MEELKIIVMISFLFSAIVLALCINNYFWLQDMKDESYFIKQQVEKTRICKK